MFLQFQIVTQILLLLVRTFAYAKELAEYLAPRLEDSITRNHFPTEVSIGARPNLFTSTYSL